ncbi:MAG: HAD-IC family P-type ATPase [Mycobacteriales bacterium]
MSLTDLDAGRTLALIGVADQLRPAAPHVVHALRHLGVTRQVMLTGDNPAAAAAIAAEAGVDGYHAELLPEDKTAEIAALKPGRRVVAMLGDGVNDAPAMATAHVAIAMGAAGTDVALETADVALMADDLTRLPAAIRLARRARVNITQNIMLSLASVAVLVAAALGGLLNLTEGVILNEGTALLIIANGLRMLRPHPHQDTATSNRTAARRPGPPVTPPAR